MTASHFTADGEQEKYEEIFCSIQFTRRIHNQLIFLLVLNTILSVTAFLGNTLILLALKKVTSLHPPSKLLYRNLAATDLCVGLVVEPLSVTSLIAAVTGRWNICRHAFVANYVTGYILFGVTLSTITAISLDRLLALLLRLRYRHHVTLKRTCLAVTALWIVPVVCTTMHFWNHQITAWYSSILVSFSLALSTAFFAKIFHALRHHQIHPQNLIHQGQSSEANLLHMSRYRKAVSSALWVQLALVICYLPITIVEALTIQGLSPSVVIAKEFAGTLFYLNSTLNPILYCWKMNEVRQAVKEIIGELGCLFCLHCLDR